MDIDHVHFYVEDARRSRDWFVQTMGFQALGGITAGQTRTEAVQCGPVAFVLSSPLAQAGPVAAYLQAHPPGVVDLAFRVPNVAIRIQSAIAAGAKLLQPLQTHHLPQGQLTWAQIQGWGKLRHTLVTRSAITPSWLPTPESATDSSSGLHLLPQPDRPPPTTLDLIGIDHAVLNVTQGDLQPAVAWYQRVLGFQPDRRFAIQTERSGLRSAVLTHPEGTAQLPINEPNSSASQIQEFLDLNRGPGIQHLALGTGNILRAIADLRQRGLVFLETPTSYYTQLRQRYRDWVIMPDWRAIEAQQILVDWPELNPKALLLQIFTQPIFSQPTFFFEVIERQAQAQGFGEGNFLALFEAIEREQIKRGTFTPAADCH